MWLALPGVWSDPQALFAVHHLKNSRCGQSRPSFVRRNRLASRSIRRALYGRFGAVRLPRVAHHQSSDPRLSAGLDVAYRSLSGREAAAAHPRTDPEELTRMSTDSSLDLRLAAASNASLPVSALPACAQDIAAAVRAAVALRADCPIDVLDNLVKDDAGVVRIAAAANPGLVSRQLAALQFDNNTEVCVTAVRHMSIRARQPTAH